MLGLNGKETMQKTKKIFCAVIITVLVVCIFISLSPVRWEVYVCGGSYTSDIYDKYIGDLVPLYADNHKEYTAVAAETLSNYKITWKGRKLYLDVELEVVGKDGSKGTVISEFTGTRFWIKHYSWKEQ